MLQHLGYRAIPHFGVGGSAANVSVTHARCARIFSPQDSQTADYKGILQDIRDAWHGKPRDADRTYKLLSTLLQFLQWRAPPPVHIIQQSFYSGLIVDIFTSMQSEQCQEQALKLICASLDIYPETIPTFIRADVLSPLLTFLEHRGSMRLPRKDILPFAVICCLAKFALVQSSLPILLDPIDAHEPFFSQCIQFLDEIVSEPDDAPHEATFPHKTEGKIYELFQNIAQWPDVGAAVTDVVFECYARVFEMQRLGLYRIVLSALKTLSCSRPDLHVCILSQNLSGPIYDILSEPDSYKAYNCIPDAVCLGLGFIRADASLSPNFVARSLFQIAQDFSQENDATCDTALFALSEKLWADHGEWADFDYESLFQFCSAQFSNPSLCFDRKMATAVLVFAFLAAKGLAYCGNGIALIGSAFEVAEAGNILLVEAAIMATDRLVEEIAQSGQILDGELLQAVTGFLQSVDGTGDERQCAKAAAQLELIGSERREE